MADTGRETDDSLLSGSGHLADAQTPVSAPGGAPASTSRDHLAGSRRHLRAVLETARAVSSSLRLEEVLGLATQRMASLVGADRCGLWLLDRTGKTLRPSAAYGMPAELLGEWRRSLLALDAEPLSKEALETGAPVLVPDAMGDPRTDKNAVRFYGDRTILVLPMVAREEAQGTLFLNHVTKSHDYSTVEIETAMAVARQAAVAIQNAKLHRETEKQRQQLLVSFKEVGQALASGLDPDQTLQLVADLAARMLGAKASTILLLDNAEACLRPRASAGLPIKPGRAAHRRLREGMSWQVAQEGVPKLVDDLSGSNRPVWIEELGARDLRCYLGVPLLLRGRTVGVLAVFGGRPGQFGPEDTELLQSFASQAAVALDNADLFASLQARVQELTGLHRSIEVERNQLDAVIGGVSDAVVIVDGQGRLVRLNSAAEALTGWRAKDVTGRHWREILIGPTGREASGRKSSMCEILEAGRPAPYFETGLVSAGGVQRDLAASYSIIPYGSDDEVLGVLIARDVSHLREVERAKSDFFSMVSHELRTPVGLVKGYASTLLNPQIRLDEQTRQRFLAGIDGAANRLGKLIENLLTSSKVEAGLFKLSVQRMDLCRAVRNAASRAGDDAQEREIAVRLPEASVWIEGDPSQLELVLDNLLGNGLKYSPANTPILVELEERGSEVQIRVIDRGTGIAAEHLPRVFEKFYRVEGFRGSRASGSGLGLYLCRSIVEAHGGRIWVESSLGEGTCFAFAIPRAPCEAAASGPFDADPGGGDGR